MNAVTAFTALIAGVVLWLFVASRLTARSWENPGEAGSGGGVAMAPAWIGLWGFMAVATSLFSLFVSAYLMRMHHGFWCHRAREVVERSLRLEEEHDMKWHRRIWSVAVLWLRAFALEDVENGKPGQAILVSSDLVFIPREIES